MVTGVIDAIHASTSSGNIIKNAIRMQIKKAQYIKKAFITEVMLVVAYEKERKEKQSYEIKFMNKGMKGIDSQHNNALVITVNMNTFDVKMVLIDSGSSLEIMYNTMFQKLNLPPSKIKNVDSPILNFSREVVWPIAIAKVPIRLGPKQKMVEFIVMDIGSPCNAILSRG